MEFDTHLARIQGCLSLAKRLVGPLDQLTVDKDFDAVQTVVERVRDGIAGFSEKELYEINLFLLLNSSLVENDEDVQESELGHLVGIAPTISEELFVALSVEVISPHIFIIDAMSCMPLAVSHPLILSFLHLYVYNNLSKVAGYLDKLCLAIYNNIGISKCDDEFLEHFGMLRSVFECMRSQEGTANFCTYTSLLKAVLLLLKFCLKEEAPPSSQKWQHIYKRPTVLFITGDRIDKVKRFVIQQASEICLSAPSRLKSEINEKPLASFEFVRELAFECATELQKVSPCFDNLLNVLMSFAKNPQEVLDDIKKASLLSLCSNSIIKNADQHLWLKALIRHQEALEDEGALMTLPKLVDLFEEEDNIFVCNAFHTASQSKSHLLRDLAIKCFSRLSLEAKLEVLKSRVINCESQGTSVTENCELNILEALNRLVAKEGTVCKEEELMILAYESPQLVVKHVLITAAKNKLFSTSVAPKILQSLSTVFASPAKTAFQATTLADVTLSECIFNTDEINKECQGLENLVRALIKEELLNTEYFLRICIFTPLLHSVEKRQESSVILLLEILMVVQLEVPNLDAKVSLPTLLVFLGKLIEYFSRGALLEEYQGGIVREILLRNIDRILAMPNCLESFQDADKEWMLDELSILSPANRHYFSAIAPEWKLFDGQRGNQPCVTLATILPYLHVTEWHQIGKILPPVRDGSLGENSSRALTFCWAVNSIIRMGTSAASAKIHLNLISCVRNLGSVIQSYLKSGVEPGHLAAILRELVLVLEYFPKSEQFDVAVFLLPIMFDIVDRGSRDGGALTAFATILLDTSVHCVRRDLGRHLKRTLSNFVNDNPGI